MTTQNQPTNPFSPPDPQTPSQGIGHKLIQMPAVSPAQAQKIINSKKVSPAWQPTAASSKALLGNTVQGVPSLVEMTRALKNDPQLMYEFVYNNIEHKIGMGLAKGDLGTLLDGSGNSFDLCSLLAAMLRLSGKQAYYQVGQIQLTFAQASAWLGVTDTNISTVVSLLANAGVPVSLVGTAPNQEILMTHCWLKVNLGDTIVPNWVVMDPSFKSYTTKPSIDLATAMGYNAATFLSDARSGYTIDPAGNWVQNINRNNVRNSLTTLSMNLANWIRTNNPGAKTDDIVGGRQIVPVSLPVTFATSLPYQAAGDVPVEFTGDFSNAYKVSVRLVYEGIDVTFTSDQLSGHRLVLYFVPNLSNQWVPTLFLDGFPIVEGTIPVPPLFTYNLQVTVTHNAYPTTVADQTFLLFTEGPKVPGSALATVYYALGSSFGATGKGLFDYHNGLQRQFEAVYGTGPLVVQEPLIGERMAAQWASFASQYDMVTDLVSSMSGTHYTNHHLVGLVTYRIENSVSRIFSGFDIQGLARTVSNLDADNSNTAAAGIVEGMHLYALEMLAIQQQTTSNEFANQSKAVSTTRLIDAASAEGSKLYKGTAANWNSDVVPNLTGYGAGDLNFLYTTYLLAGSDLLLPQNYGTAFNAPLWTLRGWSIINPAGSAGGTIFGAYAGGLGWGWWRAQPKKKRKECEVEFVNPRTGDLILNPPPDLTIGSGSEPLLIPYFRTYDSADASQGGAMGNGWTPSFDTHVRVGSTDAPGNGAGAYSDGYLGLGSESPISAVASIAQLFINIDILSDTTLPVDKLVIAHLADQWWVDNLTGNIVIVSMPDEDLVFTKLPDGSFQQPRDNASTLTPVFLSFKMTTPQQVVYQFDSNVNQRLSSISYPSGAVTSFNYTGGKLTSVVSASGRTLTLGYTGSRISSVSDGTGRTVSYSYDSAGNLTQFTDALGQAHVYEYSAPGRMSRFFKPANPTNPVVTATYDSLGRVQSQENILGQITTFFIAGSRSEIVDPVGNSKVAYYDSADNTVREIDALGNVTGMEFDGLGRLVKKVMPEGNFTTWQYDLKNNVLTETMVPKPGSPLANIVKTNTYDPLWNKVAVATDGRGNSTTMSYDPLTGNLLKIERPLVGGQTPTVTMTWNSRGQMLTRVDETGIVTLMVYDTATENLLSVVVDSGASPHLNLTTNLGYDAVGNLTSVQDPLGRTTTFQFDVLRRMTRRTETAPFNHQTRFAYDENDNVTSVRRQTGIAATPWQIYTIGYSLSDKKIRVTDPAGKITRWFYDGADRLRRVRDAENRDYIYGYDVLNRVRTVTDPTGVVSETRLYSDNGKLRSIRDARGNLTTFTFDGFDRPNRTNYPDGTFERNQSYDANGNLLNFRTRSGNTVIRTYDVLNRILTKRPQGQPTVTYSYDLAGRLLSARKPVVAGDPSSGIFQQQWDSAGRFFKEIYPDSKEVTFELDANGNVTKIVYPDGYFVDRVYDQLNRLSAIKLNGATANAVSFSYDPLSRRTNMAFSSGGSVAYEWQLNDDLTGLTNNFVGSNLALTYGFNAVHQITSQNFSDDQYSWHPGAAGTLAYDPANSTNQYPQVGGTPFVYNGNGCLTSDGVWTHGYDTENHLLSSAKPGTDLAFVYDPFHRQAEKTATTTGTSKTRFIYSGWQRIADYDSVSGSLQNRYVYGAGLDEPLIQVSAAGVLTFLHANHQGSVLAVTDSAGAVTNKNAYGPFGEGALTGTTFGYTGQRYDSESGFLYFKRRYYDSATGRFLQPDPIGYQIDVACGCSCAGGCGDDAKPSQLNLYDFVSSDPLNNADPFGLDTLGIMIGASGTSAGTLGVLVAGATILAMGIADLKNAIDRLVKNAKKLYEGTCKNAAVKKYEDTLEEIDKAFPCPIREENPGFENRRNEKRAEAYRELLSDRAKCESGIWPGPSETLKDLSF
jgi:RHS repeat-associated protein